ncbi:receptor-type tyrosine-protein phosphatase epsilon-like [Haliotis rufescens]|uniref:receptor-type tyrosine-protein phosphatase epsilon-like n=1 Tax=Haliotis rufescens TaxID=6454 RepID=UPI00201F289D|nr:receptor-type tyrosine-protein phosphatase epsilon-like [Haliotis rufescens]
MLAKDISYGQLKVTENVAFNKTATSTSGTLKDYSWTPDKAVDGDRNQVMESGSCFHSAVNYSSMWRVDLGQQYRIHHVTVYHRNALLYRIANCTIHLNNDNSTDGKLCYTFPATVTDSVIHLVCNGSGRYLTIRNPDEGDDTLNICEVEIYVCSHGTYGKFCGKFCHCLNSSCDPDSGMCPGDCRPGWQGERCDTECDTGNYGINCNKACAERKCVAGNTSCDRHNGSCVGGCLPGWRGSDCTRVCSHGTYGNFCNELCHCLKSSCDPVNGTCPGGCRPGWQEDRCDTVCSQGTYGVGCANKCQERNCQGTSPCHHVTGKCEPGCKVGWTGEDCSRGQETLPVSTIVGCATAAVILLFFVIITVLLVRRKRKQSAASFRKRPVGQTENWNSTRSENRDGKEVGDTAERGVDEEDGDIEPPLQQDIIQVEQDHDPPVLEPDADVNLQDRHYFNVGEVGMGTAIPVSELEVKVRGMVERPEEAEDEFQELPGGFMHPHQESQLSENKGKNRFKGYYPYDYNRVVLHDDNSGGGGDYINASYVDGYDNERRYIAAQGPYRLEIVDNFWGMIWQEECRIVVMVTGLIEAGKMKCLRYWPEKGTETYGDISVTMDTQTRFANYTVTKLSVQHNQAAKKLCLEHFHFTSWPDHGVPDTSALLEFISKVKVTSREQTQPIIVHCSAGIGRTGTYIAIEGLMEQAKTEGVVDVVSIASSMRRQRTNMIQTKEQYLFVYQAMAMWLSQGDTSLDSNFLKRLNLDDLADVTMGNKTVQQHLGALQARPPMDSERNFIATVPSYTWNNGFYIMSSCPNKEDIWNAVYNTDSRTLITWGQENQAHLPSSDKDVKTSRFTASMCSKTVLSDGISVTTIDLGLKFGDTITDLPMAQDDATTTTTIHNYHLAGSVRDPGVAELIDNLLTWTQDPERGSSMIVSRTATESVLLVLLVNIASRLKDDGTVDLITDMGRLCARHGGAPFTMDDVRFCLEFSRQFLETVGTYANI